MEFVAINKMTLLDYPDKVACVLYTQGCNFKCPFCHNGLTLVAAKEEEIPFNDVLTFLKKRKGIIDGVVISGGEPTLMKDLKEKVKMIKELGYAVKLDTNGTNPDMMLDLINNKLIDYVAMDIKNSLDKYDVTSGSKVDKEKITRSIEILKSGIVDYEFRTTLIKEYHDKEEIKKMADLLDGGKRLYLQQFKISDGVINKNLHPVDEGIARQFVEILEKNILEVELRGY